MNKPPSSNHLQHDALRAVRIDELRQKYDEEQRDLRIQHVADDALAEHRRSGVRSALMRRREPLTAQRLDANSTRDTLRPRASPPETPPATISAARQCRTLRASYEKSRRKRSQTPRDAREPSLRNAAREHLQIVRTGRDGNGNRSGKKKEKKLGIDARRIRTRRIAARRYRAATSSPRDPADR